METASLSGKVTVGIVPMIAEALIVSLTLETTGSRILVAHVVESENVVQACVEVVNPKIGVTAGTDFLEDETAGQDCSKMGIVSNKRKARRNALKSKH